MEKFTARCNTSRVFRPAAHPHFAHFHNSPSVSTSLYVYYLPIQSQLCFSMKQCFSFKFLPINKQDGNSELTKKTRILPYTRRSRCWTGTSLKLRLSGSVFQFKWYLSLCNDIPRMSLTLEFSTSQRFQSKKCHIFLGHTSFPPAQQYS